MIPGLEMVRYCKRCVMPDTRVGNDFDEDGVCTACNNYEKGKLIDWDKRMEELSRLCDQHRGKGESGYDCAIAVSGGKDSHVQVHLIKEKMGMNPLLLTADSYSVTETGQRNYMNLSSSFGCDIIKLTPNLRAARSITKKALIDLGSPMWFFDSAIYAFPYRMAMKMGIKLLFYGENVSYTYGGAQKEETPSALDQADNDVVKPFDVRKWIDSEVSERDLQSVMPPRREEVIKSGLKPMYLSYFFPWDTHLNSEIAEKHGFHRLSHEWMREGFIEQYNQIDTIGYLVHAWLKYPKFAQGFATLIASRWIRAGLIDRNEGIELVKKNDHILDQRMLDDFVEFIGISHKDFWTIIDKWYNRDLFEKDRFGIWRLKDPIWGRTN